MAPPLYVAVLVAGLLCSVHADFSNIEACTYSFDDGKTTDISPLISKTDTAYMFSAKVYATSGNIFSNANYSDTMDLSFQLQFCRNITKPMYPTACNRTAPAYMYNSDTKECVALGSLNVATFEPNPFKDGVHLNYYFGDSVSHIQRYHCKIYFICDKNSTISGPGVEHMKDDYQVHFKIFTKYAC